MTPEQRAAEIRKRVEAAKAAAAAPAAKPAAPAAAKPAAPAAVKPAAPAAVKPAAPAAVKPAAPAVELDGGMSSESPPAQAVLTSEERPEVLAARAAEKARRVEQQRQAARAPDLVSAAASRSTALIPAEQAELRSLREAAVEEWNRTWRAEMLSAPEPGAFTSIPAFDPAAARGPAAEALRARTREVNARVEQSIPPNARALASTMLAAPVTPSSGDFYTRYTDYLIHQRGGDAPTLSSKERAEARAQAQRDARAALLGLRQVGMWPVPVYLDEVGGEEEAPGWFDQRVTLTPSGQSVIGESPGMYLLRNASGVLQVPAAGLLRMAAGEEGVSLFDPRRNLSFDSPYQAVMEGRLPKLQEWQDGILASENERATLTQKYNGAPTSEWSAEDRHRYQTAGLTIDGNSAALGLVVLSAAAADVLIPGIEGIPALTAYVRGAKAAREAEALIKEGKKVEAAAETMRTRFAANVYMAAGDSSIDPAVAKMARDRASQVLAETEEGRALLADMTTTGNVRSRAFPEEAETRLTNERAKLSQLEQAAEGARTNYRSADEAQRAALEGGADLPHSVDDMNALEAAREAAVSDVRAQQAVVAQQEALLRALPDADARIAEASQRAYDDLSGAASQEVRFKPAGADSPVSKTASVAATPVTPVPLGITRRDLAFLSEPDANFLRRLEALENRNKPFANQIAAGVLTTLGVKVEAGDRSAVAALGRLLRATPESALRELENVGRAIDAFDARLAVVEDAKLTSADQARVAQARNELREASADARRAKKVLLGQVPNKEAPAYIEAKKQAKDAVRNIEARVRAAGRQAQAAGLSAARAEQKAAQQAVRSYWRTADVERELLTPAVKEALDKARARVQRADAAVARTTSAAAQAAEQAAEAAQLRDAEQGLREALAAQRQPKLDPGYVAELRVAEREAKVAEARAETAARQADKAAAKKLLDDALTQVGEAKQGLREALAAQRQPKLDPGYVADLRAAEREAKVAEARAETAARQADKAAAKKLLDDALTQVDEAKGRLRESEARGRTTPRRLDPAYEAELRAAEEAVQAERDAGIQAQKNSVVRTQVDEDAVTVLTHHGWLPSTRAVPPSTASTPAVERAFQTALNREFGRERGGAWLRNRALANVYNYPYHADPTPGRFGFTLKNARANAPLSRDARDLYAALRRYEVPGRQEARNLNEFFRSLHTHSAPGGVDTIRLHDTVVVEGNKALSGVTNKASLSTSVTTEVYADGSVVSWAGYSNNNNPSFVVGRITGAQRVGKGKNAKPFLSVEVYSFDNGVPRAVDKPQTLLVRPEDLRLLRRGSSDDAADVWQRLENIENRVMGPEARRYKYAQDKVPPPLNPPKPPTLADFDYRNPQAVALTPEADQRVGELERIAQTLRDNPRYIDQAQEVIEARAAVAEAESVAEAVRAGQAAPPTTPEDVARLQTAAAQARERATELARSPVVATEAPEVIEARNNVARLRAEAAARRAGAPSARAEAALSEQAAAQQALFDMQLQALSGLKSEDAGYKAALERAKNSKEAVERLRAAPLDEGVERKALADAQRRLADLEQNPQHVNPVEEAAAAEQRAAAAEQRLDTLRSALGVVPGDPEGRAALLREQEAAQQRLAVVRGLTADTEARAEQAREAARRVAAPFDQQLALQEQALKERTRKYVEERRAARQVGAFGGADKPVAQKPPPQTTEALRRLGEEVVAIRQVLDAQARGPVAKATANFFRAASTYISSARDVSEATLGTETLRRVMRSIQADELEQDRLIISTVKSSGGRYTPPPVVHPQLLREALASGLAPQSVVDALLVAFLDTTRLPWSGSTEMQELRSLLTSVAASTTTTTPEELFEALYSASAKYADDVQNAKPGSVSLLRPKQYGASVAAKLSGTITAQANAVHMLRTLDDGVAMLGAEDAKRVGAWISGKQVDSQAQAGRDLLLASGVRPTEYRASVSSLADFGSPEAVAPSVLEPFQRVSTSAPAIADITRLGQVVAPEIYVPAAIKQRLDSAAERAIKLSAGEGRFPLANWLQRHYKQAMTLGVGPIRPIFLFSNWFNDLDQMIAHPQIGVQTAIGQAIRNALATVVGMVPGAPVALDVAGRVAGVPGADLLRQALGVADSALGRATRGLLGVGAYGNGVGLVLGRSDARLVLAGKEYSGAELYRIFAGAGVLEGHAGAELIESLEEAMAAKPLLAQMLDYLPQVNRDLAEVIQQRQRVGLALALAERVGPEEAAKITREALLDYQGALHPIDRSFVVGVFAPFWNFRKNNLRRTAQVVLTRGAYKAGAWWRAKRVVATTLSAWADERDEIGFDTTTMEPDVLARYKAAVQELAASGVTTAQIQQRLTSGKSSGSADLDELSLTYFAVDPVIAALPGYYQTRTVIWNHKKKTAEVRAYLEAGGMGRRGERPGDDWEALPLPEDSNLQGITEALALASFAWNIGRWVGGDKAAKYAAQQAGSVAVGDPTRNPYAYVILSAAGAIRPAPGRKLPPNIGQVLVDAGLATKKLRAGYESDDPATGAAADEYEMDALTMALVQITSIGQVPLELAVGAEALVSGDPRAARDIVPTATFGALRPVQVSERQSGASVDAETRARIEAETPSQAAASTLGPPPAVRAQEQLQEYIDQRGLSIPSTLITNDSVVATLGKMRRARTTRPTARPRQEDTLVAEDFNNMRAWLIVINGVPAADVAALDTRAVVDRFEVANAGLLSTP